MKVKDIIYMDWGKPNLRCCYYDEDSDSLIDVDYEDYYFDEVLGLTIIQNDIAIVVEKKEEEQND